MNNISKSSILGPPATTKQLICNAKAGAKILGKGAFAYVVGKCKLNDLQDNNYVVKVLNLDTIIEESKRNTAIALFEKERKLLYVLDNQFVIKAFQDITVNKKPGIYTLVLEYCNGGSLYDYLTENPLGLTIPVEDILNKFVYDIGAALIYIHGYGIIHCDIKPENILIHTVGMGLQSHASGTGVPRNSKPTPGELEFNVNGTHDNRGNRGNNGDFQLKLTDFGLYGKVNEKANLRGTPGQIPVHQYYSSKDLRKYEWIQCPNINLIKPKKSNYLYTFTYNYDWYAYFCTIYNILHKIIYESFDEFNVKYDTGVKNNRKYKVINPAIYLNLSVFRKWPTLYKLLALLMELDLQVFFTGKDKLDMQPGSIYLRLYTLLDERGLLIDRYNRFNSVNSAGGISLYYPRIPINIVLHGDKCYNIIEQDGYRYINNSRPICYPDFAGLIAELYGTEIIRDNISYNSQANNQRRSSSITKKSSRPTSSHNKHNRRLASRAVSTLTENPGYREARSNSKFKYSQW